MRDLGRSVWQSGFLKDDLFKSTKTIYKMVEQKDIRTQTTNLFRLPGKSSILIITVSIVDQQVAGQTGLITIATTGPTQFYQALGRREFLTRDPTLIVGIKSSSFFSNVLTSSMVLPRRPAI